MPESSSSNRSQALALELDQAIRRGQWGIGQTLPPTRQIAREYGMSLATVQSGLRQLESAGLVKRHPRRGVVVQSRLGRDWGRGETVRQIGIVARDLPALGGDDWSYRIGRAAGEAITRHKLHPILLPHETGPDAAEEIFRRIEAGGSALMGVIAFNGDMVIRLMAKLDRIRMPWVVINRYDPWTIHNFVAADNLWGCRMVGECFARMRLRRVLVLMARGVNHSETEKEKISGLIHGFLALGEPISGIDYLLCGDAVPCRELVKEYLRGHGPPQAIFSLDDAMASGAIAACVEAGLSVPEQVKIVGGAGLDLGLHTRPTLSVIAQPMAEMGRQACEMLLEMIESGRNRIERRRIKGKLILRESFPLPPEVRAVLEQSYPGMIE